MRVMVLVKATADSEKGNLPTTEMFRGALEDIGPPISASGGKQEGGNTA